MEVVSENKSFGGVQGVYSHASKVCNCDMTFAVFMPPNAEGAKVPALWYLSGLTCTHENAMTKAGAQAWAAKHGIALIFPDTSPRGDDVADDEAYDLGKGAGFYVNATQAPWSGHFNMWSYITEELYALVAENFAIQKDAQGITGHSMGGHGALTIALTFPEKFKSVSAFAPISNPTASDWGRKQFTAYLGEDEEAWQAHDASLLLASRGYHNPILVDQGQADNFLDLLRTDALEEAVKSSGVEATIRRQEGYDHSYYFVSSFMEDHVAFHAKLLK